VHCSLLLLTAHGSSLDFETGRNCDRFTLGIPYCGTQIECKSTVFESRSNEVWHVIYVLHQSCFSVYTGEVIFDRNHPALPPDIIFSSEDDQMEFNPDIEKLNVCQ